MSRRDDQRYQARAAQLDRAARDGQNIRALLEAEKAARLAEQLDQAAARLSQE
jgi:hypothetical protein